MKLMTLKFVMDVNIGESAGTQTADGTQAVLDDYIEKQRSHSNRDSNEDGQGVTEVNKDRDKNRLVTINVFKTLKKFFEMHDEMEGTGKLTVQQICDCHRVLMENVRNDAGELRTTYVFSIWKDEEHVYPESWVAEQMLYTSVDHHCAHMTHYHEELLTKKAPKEKSFRYLFKCAARLLFDFVDAHPFGDGNGRMCRLLGNYVLSLITPFPVALYSSGEGRCGREDYMNAIVECRKNREKGPGTLAAMLIEGTWRGWKSLFHILDERNLTLKVVGPVVVHQRDAIEDRDKKIIDAIKRYNTKSDSHIPECVPEAINEERDIPDKDGVRRKVPLCDDTVLHLHIYA